MAAVAISSPPCGVRLAYAASAVGETYPTSWHVQHSAGARGPVPARWLCYRGPRPPGRAQGANGAPTIVGALRTPCAAYCVYTWW